MVPVVLYGHETQAVTVMVEHRSGVSCNQNVEEMHNIKIQ
jgi:hypothetical protein